MPKKVLDVGNCGPDHASITRFLTSHFDCEVLQADRAADALSLARETPFDLVLVNRKLDADYSDGLDVIRQLKEDPATSDVPVMLITNYPEHQDQAEQVGALRGFGKLELQSAETVERMRAVLG